jgi:hypothetical protein
MPDPNWFYSTLAQSAAAIVAIIGGFLTSRLLADIGQARQEANRLERVYWMAMTTAGDLMWKPDNTAGLLSIAADMLKTGRLRQYPWLLRMQAMQAGIDPGTAPSQGLPQAMDEVADLLKRLSAWARELMPRQIVTDSETKKREQEATKRLFDDQSAVIDRLNKCSGISQAESSMTVLYVLDQWRGVPEFWTLYRGLEEDYMRFQDGLRGKPYYAGLLLLGAMFVANVLFPLTRLSASSLTDKCVLLALLSAGVLAFAVYVHRLIRRLWALRAIGQANEGVAMWEAMRGRLS